MIIDPPPKEDTSESSGGGNSEDDDSKNPVCDALEFKLLLKKYFQTTGPDYFS